MFTYRNIEFKKHPKESYAVAKGDIYNNSGTNYNSVAFRMVIFVKGAQVINTVITVHGMGAGCKKVFEKPIRDLDGKLINNIVRYEIIPEGAY
ncbi:MAG: hypothetical protein WC301_02550 [Candidatus Omnitrophota bacterium]|jgi:hypothetical protein